MASADTTDDLPNGMCRDEPTKLLRYARADQHRAFELRKPLNSDIQKLIASHRSGKPPPFSYAELVVMAVVSFDAKEAYNEHATYGDILKWIMSSFPYYQDKVATYLLGTLCSNMILDVSPLECLGLIDYKLADVFFDHESPLRDCLTGQTDDERTFTVDITHAQSFLRRWIAPEKERKGVFRFLDLPPEFRNRIYHMLLVFPGPAILVTFDNKYKNLNWAIHGRMYGDSGYQSCSPSGRSRECKCEGYFRMKSMKDILDMALTCKQVASESIPVFYGGNTFALRERKAVEAFSGTMSTHCLRHVKKLHLHLVIEDDLCLARNRSLCSAIDHLNDVASLEEVTVVIAVDYTYQEPPDPSCVHIDPRTVQDVPCFAGLTRLLAKAKKSEVMCAKQRIPIGHPLHDLADVVNLFIRDMSKSKARATEAVLEEARGVVQEEEAQENAHSDKTQEEAQDGEIQEATQLSDLQGSGRGEGKGIKVIADAEQDAGDVLLLLFQGPGGSGQELLG